jgi:hypothetical protein
MIIRFKNDIKRQRSLLYIIIVISVILYFKLFIRYQYEIKSKVSITETQIEVELNEIVNLQSIFMVCFFIFMKYKLLSI